MGFTASAVGVAVWLELVLVSIVHFSWGSSFELCFYFSVFFSSSTKTSLTL
jgi:hypothetical protein